MTTFIYLTMGVIVVAFLVASLSDALRDGGARKAWAKRREIWAHLKQWGFTLFLFLTGVHDATRPGLLHWFMAAVFLMWGTSRVVQQTIDERVKAATKAREATR